MRASRQASTGAAPIAGNASASSVETGATGKPAPNASPWATATPMRTPVNDPGPMPAAIASSAPKASPASASSSSTIDSTRSVVPWPDSANRSMTESPINKAAEHASVDASSARIRMLSARLRRETQREEPRGERRIGEHRTRRQGGEKRAPVGFRADARIADHDDAEILEVADQPARTLFQRQYRLRQLVFHEPVAAAAPDALEAGREQRIIGRRERQLVDRDDRQRLALDVDAFPKAPRREQHGVAEFPEPREQGFARRLTLDQHRERRIRKSAAQGLYALGEPAIARVEQERAPAAGLEQ